MDHTVPLIAVLPYHNVLHLRSQATNKSLEVKSLMGSSAVAVVTGWDQIPANFQQETYFFTLYGAE